MTRFSANLGLLWQDRPLPDAIRAAKAAGFDAVECHWPFDIAVEEVTGALAATGLSMLGLNTRRGDIASGDNGLAALPGRAAEARAAIDEALAYARAIGARNVHVMAGFAAGEEAAAAYRDNLAYAARRAADTGQTILIEPLNGYDVPGYFLAGAEQAAEIIAVVGAANLKLMFDCYHVQLIQGDITHRLERLLPCIGHVQLASAPDRGAPDHGELDYVHIVRTLANLGWDAPLGAEYKPTNGMAGDLNWMERLRAG